MYSPNPVGCAGWLPKLVLAFWNKFVGCDWVDGNSEVPAGCPNAEVEGLPKAVAGFPKSWDCPNGLALAVGAVPNPTYVYKC